MIMFIVLAKATWRSTGPRENGWSILPC